VLLNVFEDTRFSWPVLAKPKPHRRVLRQIVSFGCVLANPEFAGRTLLKPVSWICIILTLFSVTCFSETMFFWTCFAETWVSLTCLANSGSPGRILSKKKMGSGRFLVKSGSPRCSLAKLGFSGNVLQTLGTQERRVETRFSRAFWRNYSLLRVFWRKGSTLDVFSSKMVNRTCFA